VSERPQNKNLKKFKPGTSGNPTGKRKGQITVERVRDVVAKLSGMPDAVISRAKEILQFLEFQSSGEGKESSTKKGSKADSIQTDLLGQIVAGTKTSGNNLKIMQSIFQQSTRNEKDRINEEIIEELKEMNVDNLTPLEALNKLNKIIERIKASYEQMK